MTMICTGLEAAALAVAALAAAAVADTTRAPGVTTRTDTSARVLYQQQHCDMLSCMHTKHFENESIRPCSCSAHPGGDGATNGSYQDGGPAPCALLPGTCLAFAPVQSHACQADVTPLCRSKPRPVLKRPLRLSPVLSSRVNQRVS